MSVKNLIALEAYLKRQKNPVSQNRIQVDLKINHYALKDCLFYLRMIRKVIYKNKRYLWNEDG
jgi:hypothetical protein